MTMKTIRQHREETRGRAALPDYASHMIVCVEAVEDGVPTGELFNAFLPEPEPFQGLGDLILKMDQIYDELDCPQIDREDRTFAWEGRKQHSRLIPCQSGASVHPPLPALEQGKKLTLSVNTRYRQNGSWQGTVCCPQLRREVPYVSALQFLKLAAEAVETLFPR